MKTKLFTIAMTAALMLTAMTKVQAQNFDGPCLPPSHGLDDHQSAFCGVTQTIALAAGANYVSFYVDITLNDLKAALVEASPSSTIKIIGQNNSTTYDPVRHRWNGTLQWNEAQMFIIRVTDVCEISFESMPLDPAEHSVDIVSGANYIAFPLMEGMSLTDAFAGFAVNGDKVLSQTSSATYNRGRWQGQGLTNLEPGKGYIYISVDSKTLVFPSSK